LETYPLQAVELETFDLITANDVEGMKRKMAERNVNLNGSNPSNQHTGVMECALLGREDILKVCDDAGLVRSQPTKLTNYCRCMWMLEQI
jgi:hypothetical protein